MLTRIPSSRMRLGASALLLTLAGGFAAPFTPVAQAATTVPIGAVELSPGPPNDTQAVAPNIVVTFDDSGSMANNYMGDNRPFDNGSWTGPWRCAGVIDPRVTDKANILARAMNGVYFNPNVVYSPPQRADGTVFPQADANLLRVPLDGIGVNRPYGAVTLASAGTYGNNPKGPTDASSPTGATDLTGTVTLKYPTVKTTYATFGTTCAANADAGSCATNSSGTTGSGSSKTNVYYVSGSDGSSGSGTATVYYGTGLKIKTSTSSGYTLVTGDTTSATKNYATWTVTTTNTSGTPTLSSDNRWQCGYSTSPMDPTKTDPDGGTYPNGGPYYYRYKSSAPAIAVDSYGNPDAASQANIYTASNWEAVAVPNTTVTINGQSVNQWQNFANWYAYYRTRNLMTRSSLSRVFGGLGNPTPDGGFGSTLRVAWQNLYTSDTFRLTDPTIISSLLDANAPACDASSTTTSNPTAVALQTGTVKTPPNCYRSAFFNWIFQVPATSDTPSRASTIRAGRFFQRGNGNTGGTGDLHDPYWQPPKTGTGDGNELVCRQNFHMLVTDGYSNESDPTLPTTANNANQPFRDINAGFTLPDGTAYSSSAAESRAFWDVRGADYPSSMANVAFNYWATNLRPDLYNAAIANGVKNPVAPYLPDPSTGVVTGATSSALEKYFNPKNDPANWPHLVQYMVTLGVSGRLTQSDDYDCKKTPNDLCSLRTGAATSYASGGTSIGWPRPVNNAPEGIDDVWHATVNSRGTYFNAGDPQSLVDQLSNILSNIAARSAQPTTSAVNASVLTLGALSFNTGYDSGDWSGVLQAVTLNEDGTTAGLIWDAATLLNDASTTPPASRNILTGSMDSTGKVTGMAFRPTAAFDTSEQAGLNAPVSTDATNDTLANRVDYLRGVRAQETSGAMRKRNSLLGAIINSQAVYVSYPSSGYTSNWPAGSAEAATAAQTYDDFVSKNASRAGTLYVGANDGMLHAFDASLKCNARDASGNCTSYGPEQNASAGRERWAYVPRAVYGNLGNLTSKNSFKYAPTVDGTPVVRDVFFSDNKWHTILVGGLRLGGRGVYALDVTDPTAVTEASAGSSVLWEFDADAPAVTGVGDPADLGYTFGQPNVGRLANGKWVVIVPTSYYPDCSAKTRPANCTTLAAASNAYSALFVLDAQTGKMLAELKTPTTITGVTSYGLSSPVLGDYNNDQIDDVAFAGDLAGNLWRFDLSDATPANWTVTLAYQGASDSSGKQGVQPITVMPRLFPDPATNRFMVVFGTGKYLGASDNTSTSAATQSIYGIRDVLNSSGIPKTITRDTLQAQTLSEEVVTDTADPNVGATLRKQTNNTVSSDKGGWYSDLMITNASGTVTNAGERVVVTPGAVFNTNTVIISTVIPGSSDPCNPTVQGAAMLLNAATGGPGSGISSLGGYPYVGARVNNVRTSGTIPVTTTVGGGKTLLPGLTLTGKKKNSEQPFSGDAPIWRRRSWSEINNVR